jgi:hypothetical protein
LQGCNQFSSNRRSRKNQWMHHALSLSLSAFTSLEENC